MVDNPTLYMMIGVPAAGKSTWRAAQNFDPSTTVVVSTDDYLDSWAELRGTTYNSVFQGSIQHAEAAMMADLRAAVAAELGYTCSAGVAHTKLMAKLCSG